MKRENSMKTIAILVFCVALCACGAGDEAESGNTAADTLTRAQRDSITAESNLPGASAVGRALETSDIAAERAAQMDSIEP